MKTKRIRDFDDWPPQRGNAYPKGSIPPNADQAVLKEVVKVQDKSVDLVCHFENKTHNYTFNAPTPEIAQKVAVVLANKIGKTLIELGDLQVET